MRRFKLCTECPSCFTTNARVKYIIGMDYNDQNVYYAIDGTRHFLISEGAGHSKDLILEFPAKPEKEPKEVDYSNLPNSKQIFLHNWNQWNNKFGDGNDIEISVDKSAKLICALISVGYDLKSSGDWYSFLINYIASIGDHHTKYERVLIIREGQHFEHINFALSTVPDWGVYQQFGQQQMLPSDFMVDIRSRSDEDFTWFYVIFHRLTLFQRAMLWEDWYRRKEEKGEISLLEFAQTEWMLRGLLINNYKDVKSRYT